MTNGLLVKNESGKYLFYNSLAEFTAVLSMADWQHYLTGLNPYQDKILAHEDEILNKLSLNLGIDRKYLDKTKNSLSVLDSALDGINPDQDFIAANFLGVYFYIGEVIVRAGIGSWKLKYIEEDKLWEPMLVDNMNQEMALGIHLMNDLYESEGGVPTDWIKENYEGGLSRANRKVISNHPKTTSFPPETYLFS